MVSLYNDGEDKILFLQLLVSHDSSIGIYKHMRNVHSAKFSCSSALVPFIREKEETQKAQITIKSCMCF